MFTGLGCPPRGGDRYGIGPPAPPRTIEEIVGTIEANAALVNQALWSNSVTVEARFVDDQGKEHCHNLDSNLLYLPPRNLRMDLRPGVGDQVMQIGSNAEDYWLWIEPELGAMWWGRHRHVGKPCAETISVRPDQLVAALGLSGLPTEDEGLIGPARKYGKTHDILYYLRQRPGGGYLLDREYWVDRQAPYPVRVVVFRDELGRITMSAYLDGYRATWDGGPVAAHEVSIIWPIKQGKLAMSIARIRGTPAEKVSPRAFVRPTEGDLPSGIRSVTQVDADCDAANGVDGPATSGAGDVRDTRDDRDGDSGPGGTP